MGTWQHDTVVAVTWDASRVDIMHRLVERCIAPELQERFLFGPEVNNGYRMVCLVPDGSKEGWNMSQQGDALRARFVSWLKADPAWIWVEVSFGELGIKITNDYQHQGGANV